MVGCINNCSGACIERLVAFRIGPFTSDCSCTTGIARSAKRPVARRTQIVYLFTAFAQKAALAAQARALDLVRLVRLLSLSLEQVHLMNLPMAFLRVGHLAAECL